MKKQIGYEPVLIDGEPAEQAYETSIPDTRLGLGGSPQQSRQLEAKLRRDIETTKWKETRKLTRIKCALCGKMVERKHATQKYCGTCQPKAKRARATLRVMRHRHKDTYPSRGKAGELILYVPVGNTIKQISVPALEAETLEVSRSYIKEHYPKKMHNSLFLQTDEVFLKERIRPHRRHVELDTCKPVLGGESK